MSTYSDFLRVQLRLMLYCKTPGKCKRHFLTFRHILEYKCLKPKVLLENIQFIITKFLKTILRIKLFWCVWNINLKVLFPHSSQTTPLSLIISLSSVGSCQNFVSVLLLTLSGNHNKNVSKCLLSDWCQGAEQ